MCTDQMKNRVRFAKLLLPSACSEFKSITSFSWLTVDTVEGEEAHGIVEQIMFYDLNVSWMPYDPELQRTLAFLAECKVLSYTPICAAAKVCSGLQRRCAQPYNHREASGKSSKTAGGFIFSLAAAEIILVLSNPGGLTICYAEEPPRPPPLHTHSLRPSSEPPSGQPVPTL